MPQPKEGCFSAQGGTVESWEAEAVPGRTQEGLSLLLQVHLVTWNRRRQALDSDMLSWACGEPQHPKGNSGSHTSQDTSLYS